MMEDFYTHTGNENKKNTGWERELLYSASIRRLFSSRISGAKRKVAKGKQAKQKQSDAEARDDLVGNHAVLGVFVVRSSLYS